MNTQLVFLILELAAKYGVPYVVDSINTLNKDEITADDIKNLEMKFQKPETYFND